MNKKLLNIAFRGQIYDLDASLANYVFPKGDNEWTSVVESDPREVLAKLNINGNYPCYSIIITPTSVIYAVRITTLRAGSNCAMVLLQAGGAARDGKKLIDYLNDILLYVAGYKSYAQVNQNVLEEKLNNFEELIDWQRTPNATTPNPNNLNKVGYRKYKTEDDLFKILENPYQSVYKDYRCVHIVSEESGTKPVMGSDITLIDSPLEKTYFLHLPQGVLEKNGKKYVSEKESFRLVYKRSGYNDENSGPLYVNSSAKYFTVSDDIINVRNADECGIKFKRSISILVQDELGNPINNAKWKYKNKNDNNWYYVLNFAIGDGEYDIIISAEGYADKNFSFNTTKKQRFDVVLEAKYFEKKVLLIPFWSNKKKLNQQEPVTIKYSANTSLFKLYENVLNPITKKEKPTLYITKKSTKPLFIMVCVLALLVGFSLGVGAGYLKWCNQEQPLEISVETGDSQPKGQEPEKPENKAEEQTDKEKHDVSYLNNNNEWNLDLLQSQKYKDFFNNVVANRTEYKNVKWEDYSEITNENWVKIQEIIEESVRTSGWSKFNELNYNDSLDGLKKGNIRQLNVMEAARKKVNKVGSSRKDHDKPIGSKKEK